MALHKLLVDDFYDDKYLLFAVHCRLEDYRLAYMLNKHLGLRLLRKEKDLDLNYTSSSYAVYEYYDVPKDITWNLIANICMREEESLASSGVLFANDIKISKTYNLLPEMKQVDFFIKISNDTRHINEKLVISKLQGISQIITTYTVDLNKIKSKEHLIF
ncbi:MAG: IPExxxVDY family protein [Winogradskyella sp.]|uniref:IPExxxVDY family protein n=1 Tax=Winogradskyella sp. TaxID=1883156 RepID=UPI0017CD4B69|nr:IPExxxVDY family protein [Winogradskyella sp.]MBT8244347.1 IPExxxVDY family protein [Winogradskyella sp.]NNK22742.1 IPExxxVDY family protein [Winogradskyella sp.]